MAMYDDIIIGAGSAGCVLAARLTEDARRKVLLLEAGPDYPTFDSLPDDLRYGRAMSFVDHDWELRADAVRGRAIFFPRGKVVGGSSAVNAMVALRGMPHDYDEWEALGCDGWAWKDVLPYFKKLETDADFPEGELHGHDGPIYIRRLLREEQSPAARAFYDACRGAGYADVTDHNDPAQEGVGAVPMNMKEGIRQSAALAYLAPARARDNLTIAPDALVERVLVEGGRATGVRVVRSGTVSTYLAGRVFVCAGAIHSPPLLLRSGIGPAAVLRSLEIPLLLDRPGVGQNLMDHASVGIVCVPREGSLDTTRPQLQTYARYTAPGSSERCDMQLALVVHMDLRLRAPEAVDLVGTAVPFIVVAQVERVKSRGRLVFESAAPGVDPRIELEFLSHPEDQKKLLDGARRAWAIANAPAMREHVDRIALVTQSMIDDDDQLLALMKALCTSGFHPSGTCKMGQASDPTAVVDAGCRVHGTDNLFVVDASVMPNVPSVNTNLPTLMIAEKIAAAVR